MLLLNSKNGRFKSKLSGGEFFFFFFFETAENVFRHEVSMDNPIILKFGYLIFNFKSEVLGVFFFFYLQAPVKGVHTKLNKLISAR